MLTRTQIEKNAERRARLASRLSELNEALRGNPLQDALLQERDRIQRELKVLDRERERVGLLQGW